MMKLFVVLLLIPGSVFSQTFEFQNGHLYTGDGFTQQTFYTNQGLLTFQPPESVDSVIDLNSQYVIPPFSETHNHNLESSYQIDKTINRYLQDGVFYVKLQSSIKKRIAPLMVHYNKPTGLDVSLAHAPITGTGGHPIAIREWYLKQGYFDDLFKTIEEVEGHGYWIVDSQDDLQKKWPKIKAMEPDFIKVMLQHAEEYALRKDDTTYHGNKGLNPALLPDLVERAHQDGYRVSVHVFTVADFHYAITAGADEIAHLPGYRAGGRIDPQDAAQAAKNGTVVLTTASLALKNKDSEQYEQLLSDIKANLLLLKNAGVELAVGSDTYDDTSVGEIEFLRSLQVFTNKELLHMWCVSAAQTIFPKRKVGALKEGFEASFLVLAGDPLEEWSNTRQIKIRVKAGHFLK